MSSGISAMIALTRFDQLVKAFARTEGPLTDRQKRMLDDALALHAEACAKLKLSPRDDNASRVVDLFASGQEA
jgi:hypothetical protein